ncbi:hypothetical protein D3C74_214620 [compost metagenome]
MSFLRRFFRYSDQGAVTIFLIVIFASIFAFVAIFIDFARIFALQAKSEVLAHTVSRSVMSSYDRQLLEEYGLFAYGETDGNYIMSKVLQDNLELAERSDDLPILAVRLDSSTVEFQYPVGMYSVFERQIREHMKYRAPIDFTIELINRFKPISQVMKETSNTVDLLGKLQKLYERREARFDGMLENQRKAARLIESLSSIIPRSGSVNGSGGTDSSSSASGITAGYGEYVYRYESDLDKEPSEQQYTMELIRYRHEAGRMFSKLDNLRQAAQRQHETLLNEANTLLSEARNINEQMRAIIEEAEHRSAQEGYNVVSRTSSTSGNESIGDGGEIAQIRDKSQSLLIADSLFEHFKEDIQKQSAQYLRVQNTSASFSSMENSIISASAAESDLNSAFREFSNGTDTYLRTFSDSSPDNVLTQNMRLLEEHRSSDQERKQLEHAAAGKLKEASNMMKQISELKDKLGDYQKEFDQLEIYYNSNRSLNSSNSASTGTGSTGDGSAINNDPYDAGTEAMNGMDVLFGGLADLMKGMSDNCFQGEYIANYFELFDVSTLEELLKDSGAQKIEMLAGSFAPKKQEVEYILYGFHNPVGNIAAAYGEIFGMRLAIRTMEGLVKHASKGNPLVILAAALLYGVEHAVKDMLDLAKEGSVYLSDFLKVKLSYKDHLRIFLLLHGRSEKRLSRMLAVVQNNTAISPDTRSTYLKGEVTVSLPLWFLPGIAKALGNMGALQGRVEGSRYYVTKQADFSY